jgi:LysR family transcriptional regulator of gallate degradation
MDLRELESFLATAREGGITRAAQKLGVSQPSLTRSIAQLERDLGVKLFSRTTRGTSITDDGRRLLPHAEAILNETERMRSRFAAGAGAPLEKALIGASPNLLIEHLPDAIHNFLCAAPEFGVLLRSGTFETLTAWLHAHEIEIAVCIVPDTFSRSAVFLADFSIETIIQDRFLPCAAIDHPAHDNPRDLVTLASYGWAVPHQMSLSYRFETAFLRAGVAQPAQRLNCASMSLMLIGVVEMGLVGLLPASFIAANADRIMPVDVPTLNFPYSIGLITPKQRSLSRATMAFVEALRAQGSDADDAADAPQPATDTPVLAGPSSSR